MKVIALTTAAVFAASTAFAGTMDSAAMDAPDMVEMVEPATTGSGALGWIIPLVAVAAIALASDD